MGCDLRGCADSAGVSDILPTGKSRTHNPLALDSNPSGPDPNGLMVCPALGSRFAGKSCPGPTSEIPNSQPVFAWGSNHTRSYNSARHRVRFSFKGELLSLKIGTLRESVARISSGVEYLSSGPLTSLG